MSYVRRITTQHELKSPTEQIHNQQIICSEREMQYLYVTVSKSVYPRVFTVALHLLYNNNFHSHILTAKNSGLTFILIYLPSMHE